MHQRIAILDFGSQFTQLIARRVREAGVYSEILPCTASIEDVKALEPHGLILSGGPSSVYDEGAPQLNPELLHLKRADQSPVPVLGVCYGLQAMAHALGGEVQPAAKREFGRAAIRVDSDTLLFKDVPEGSNIWMSHGDHLTKLPEGYEVIAHTSNAPIAAVRSTKEPHYGVQFHPEVHHSENGKLILENFALRICKCDGDWSAASFIEEKKA